MKLKRLTITLALFVFACLMQAIGYGVIAFTAWMLWMTFAPGGPFPILEGLALALGAHTLGIAWSLAREETAALLADD